RPKLCPGWALSLRLLPVMLEGLSPDRCVGGDHRIANGVVAERAKAPPCQGEDLRTGDRGFKSHRRRALLNRRCPTTGRNAGILSFRPRRRAGRFIEDSPTATRSVVKVERFRARVK